MHLGLDVLALDFQKPGLSSNAHARLDTLELGGGAVPTRQKLEKLEQGLGKLEREQLRTEPWASFPTCARANKYDNDLDSMSKTRPSSSIYPTNLPIHGRSTNPRIPAKLKLFGKSRASNAPGLTNVLLLRDRLPGLEKLSHFTCYACLLAPPVYTLNCGHMVCNHCVDDFSNPQWLESQLGTGAQVGFSNNCNLQQFDEHVIQCPFPSCDGFALRKQAPQQAAPRVLSLDG